MKKTRFVITILVLAIAASAQSAPQQSGRIQRWTPAGARVVVRDSTFPSASLGREMHYRVILPSNHDSGVRRYPVLYLLHGLTGSYEDWESRTHLDDYAEGLPLIIVMPDGGDSWYANSAGEPQEKWEDYIVKDLISYIDAHFFTIQTRHARAVAGLSMGGYGAMKFALKYPGTFVFAASMSGALNAARGDLKPRAGSKFAEQLVAIFGPDGSETRVQNDVYALASKANPDSLPYLWVACGTEDSTLIAPNQEFAALLVKQKIRHAYSESPGAHTWQYWDEQIANILPLLMDRFFRANPRPKAVSRKP